MAYLCNKPKFRLHLKIPEALEYSRLVIGLLNFYITYFFAAFSTIFFFWANRQVGYFYLHETQALDLLQNIHVCVSQRRTENHDGE